MRKVSIYVHAICNISNDNKHRQLFSLIRLHSPILGKCEVVKTNHNLDTQYTTSEIQIWQEN